MIAALFVDAQGAYSDLAGIDAWDELRDARCYSGPYPVVAHPPCAAWSRYALARQGAWGLPAFEDGGCFAAAVAAVRRWGGVLEHPAHSSAWARYGLPRPSTYGVWQQTLLGEWVAWLDQGAYGHRLRKPTWLFYVGRSVPDPLVTFLPAGLRTVDGVTSSWRSPTPPAMRDYLVRLAESA